MKKIAQRWLEIGENELGFAKWGLESDDFFSQICAQFHQAVEKFLKAFLVEENFNFKKTHDLVWLLQQCASFDSKFEKFKNDCSFLSDFYIELRYPDAYPVKIKRDALRAV